MKRLLTVLIVTVAFAIGVWFQFDRAVPTALGDEVEQISGVFDRLPAGATLVMSIDLSELGSILPIIPTNLFLGADAPVMTAVDQVLSRHYGYHFSNPTQIGVYLDLEQEALAFIAIGSLSGAPQRQPDRTHQNVNLFMFDDGQTMGESLWLAFSSDALIVGTLEGVTGILDVSAGGAQSVNQGCTQILAQRSLSHGLTILVDAGAIGSIMGPQLEGLEQLGLQHILFTAAGENIEALMQFTSQEFAETVNQIVAQGIQELREPILQLRQQAEETDSMLEELILRVSVALSEHMFERSLSHGIEGNFLRIQMVEMATSYFMMGSAAAVAIPAFLRYQQRSKTVEAQVNLRRIYDSAVSYYDTNHTTMRGEDLPSQFPASVPLTPATIPCGQPSNPRSADWSQPTWQALNFAVSEPHYYSYQFDSHGVGADAFFTVSAFGDLDCDGVHSTFVRLGSVGADGDVRWITGGAGLYMDNELE